jgi:hypothetical protein
MGIASSQEIDSYTTDNLRDNKEIKILTYDDNRLMNKKTHKPIPIEIKGLQVAPFPELFFNVELKIMMPVGSSQNIAAQITSGKNGCLEHLAHPLYLLKKEDQILIGRKYKENKKVVYDYNANNVKLSYNYQSHIPALSLSGTQTDIFQNLPQAPEVTGDQVQRHTMVLALSPMFDPDKGGISEKAVDVTFIPYTPPRLSAMLRTLLQNRK